MTKCHSLACLYYELEFIHLLILEIMDKRIEIAINELISMEIWSANFYLSLLVYFKEQDLPVLASWLDMQPHDNMERVYCMMKQVYQCGGYVRMREISWKPEKWKNLLEALDRLAEHERYMANQIAALLAFTKEVDMSIYSFCKQLYQSRVYVTDVFIELFYILAKRYSRELPYNPFRD